jgi:RNA polymerase sigma-70 factor (ECF subfamily)
MVNQDQGGTTDLSAQTDEELLENYKNQNCQNSFTAIYQRWHERIAKYLLRYTTDDTLIEDAVQHAFMRLHTRHAELAANSRLSSWLFSLAANFAIDTLRSAANNLVYGFEDMKSHTGSRDGSSIAFDPQDDRVEREAEIAVDRELIERALGTVSAQDRRLIELIYLEDMTYAQAATQVSMPLGTVKAKVARAFAVLRLSLEGESAAEAA